MDKKALSLAIFRDCDVIPADEAIEGVLSLLEPRERMVIEQRFGDKRKTLAEIGRTLPRYNGGIGLTRERVREIEAKALRKLRHPKRARILRPGGEL